MTKDTVVAFRTPDGFSPDPLTDLLRQGARDLIAQAVEAELSAFLGTHADQTDAAGRSRLVRHGHLPEREVPTGIGAVPVQVPMGFPLEPHFDNVVSFRLHQVSRFIAGMDQIR